MFVIAKLLDPLIGSVITSGDILVLYVATRGFSASSEAAMDSASSNVSTPLLARAAASAAKILLSSDLITIASEEGRRAMRRSKSVILFEIITDNASGMVIR